MKVSREQSYSLQECLISMKSTPYIKPWKRRWRWRQYSESRVFIVDPDHLHTLKKSLGLQQSVTWPVCTWHPTEIENCATDIFIDDTETTRCVTKQELTKKTQEQLTEALLVLRRTFFLSASNNLCHVWKLSHICLEWYLK